MSIATEIQRIKNNVLSAFAAVTAKGGTYTDDNSDNLTEAIASIPQGGGQALINGRKFECGTFTLPSSITEDYTIQHTLGKEPSAVFLWVVDPDYSVRGQIGKFRADSTSQLNSIAATAVNGSFGDGLGGSSSRYRTVWSSSTITFNCDSIYPLLPNIEYQWLAIE